MTKLNALNENRPVLDYIEEIEKGDERYIDHVMPIGEFLTREQIHEALEDLPEDIRLVAIRVNPVIKP